MGKAAYLFFNGRVEGISGYSAVIETIQRLLGMNFYIHGSGALDAKPKEELLRELDYPCIELLVYDPERITSGEATPLLVDNIISRAREIQGFCNAMQERFRVFNLAPPAAFVIAHT